MFFNDLVEAKCLCWSAFGDKRFQERFQVWSPGTVPLWNEEFSFLWLEKVLEAKLPCKYV